MNVKPFLIGGEWVQGTGTPFDSVNPANGELNAKIGGASAADVDHAVRNAQRAQRDPRWRNMLPHERARLLNRVADLIMERSSELAAIQMCENGMPWCRRIRDTAARGRDGRETACLADG